MKCGYCINGLEVNANIELEVVDCKSLSKKFACFSVMFFNRSYNVDAHNLVGNDRRLDCKTWLSFISSLNVSPFSISVFV